MNALERRTSLGISPQGEAFLAYLVGWISGLVILLLERENRLVRFHAAQSVVTFLGLTALGMVVNFIPIIGLLVSFLLAPVTLVLWIVLLVNAIRRTPEEPPLRLPVAAELADRLVAAM